MQHVVLLHLEMQGLHKLYSVTHKADKSAPVDCCNMIFFLFNPELVTDKSQPNSCFPALKWDPPCKAIDLFPTQTVLKIQLSTLCSVQSRGIT